MPAYLMMAKSVGDEEMISDSPSAAAAVWTKSPEQSPKATEIPAFRPWIMLWVRTNRMSGPGSRVNSDEAMMNSMSFMGRWLLYAQTLVDLQNGGRFDIVEPTYFCDRGRVFAG